MVAPDRKAKSRPGKLQVRPVTIVTRKTLQRIDAVTEVSYLPPFTIAYQQIDSLSDSADAAAGAIRGRVDDDLIATVTVEIDPLKPLPKIAAQIDCAVLEGLMFFSERRARNGIVDFGCDAGRAGHNADK